MFLPWFRPSRTRTPPSARPGARVPRPPDGGDLRSPDAPGAVEARGGGATREPFRQPVASSLSRYMAEHGLKSTRQRSPSSTPSSSVGGHLSVEELWAEGARARRPGLGGHRVPDDEAARTSAASPTPGTSATGRPATRRRSAGITTTTSSAPGAAPSSSSRTTASRPLQDKVARQHGFQVTSAQDGARTGSVRVRASGALAAGDAPRA